MAQQVYRMVISSNAAGQFCQNILHWQFDDAEYASTSAAAQALINAWQLAAHTAWILMLPTDTTMLSIKCRRVSAPGGFEVILPITVAAAGLRAGTMSAAGIAPCIIFFPTLNQPKRGRLFLPGLSENDAIDGVYTNLYKAAIETNIDLVTDDLVLVGGGTPTARFGIYTRTNNSFIAGVFHKLSDLIGTQRRRQRPA